MTPGWPAGRSYGETFLLASKAVPDKGQRFVRRRHGVIAERDGAGSFGSRLRRVPHGVHRCERFPPQPSRNFIVRFFDISFRVWGHLGRGVRGAEGPAFLRPFA
jgi:hypothetical protein